MMSDSSSHENNNGVEMKTADVVGRVAYVSKKETFSAAHRLHSPHLSDEENRAVFGKCNNPAGHGHNYKVEVILKGKVDLKTGMVMNLTDLKRYMKKAIVEPLDHKNLDADVPFFKTTVSTTENLAIFIWEGIKEQMEDPGLLYEVRIDETEKNTVYYRGEVSA